MPACDSIRRRCEYRSFRNDKIFLASQYRCCCPEKLKQHSWLNEEVFDFEYRVDYFISSRRVRSVIYISALLLLLLHLLLSLLLIILLISHRYILEVELAVAVAYLYYLAAAVGV